jgi:hypothetical protein
MGIFASPSVPAQIPAELNFTISVLREPSKFASNSQQHAGRQTDEKAKFLAEINKFQNLQFFSF